MIIDMLQRFLSIFRTNIGVYNSIIGFVAFAVVLFSFSTLTTKPKLWTDEAVSIDIARSFLNYSRLSPQIAPGEFYENPQLIQSTGFPVTISLAVFFKIFGYGLYQARVFMLFWMVMSLLLILLIGRYLFDERKAILSVLLIASFASFYASGRTVVGEIPGFVFLLAGFYILFKYERYFLTGILWGFAVVTKPSVFILIIPTIFLTLLIEKKDWKSFFINLSKVALGMIPVGLFWILLVIPSPFLSSTWVGLWKFYTNPFSKLSGAVSASDNFVHNLINFFHSTTLIYFGLLFLLIVAGRFLVRDFKLKFVYTFTIFYSLLAFIYYLKSPGWLRYILIAELLVLLILPDATQKVVESLSAKGYLPSSKQTIISYGVVLFLVVVQVVQMLTISDIFYGNGGVRVANYINEKFPEKSVSLLNATDVSVSIQTDKRYNTYELTGMPQFGVNTLFLKKPPEIVVSYEGEKFSVEGVDVLKRSYKLDSVIDGFTIYAKNN